MGRRGKGVNEEHMSTCEMSVMMAIVECVSFKDTRRR
jgi:hypothetical protein